MRSRLLWITCSFLLMVFLIGCSGGGNTSNPVSPVTNESDTEEPGGRILWGVWGIHFDAGALQAEAVPIRNLSTHYDITDMLLPPECDDCLEIVVNSFDPVTRILNADVTLVNQFPISGYDVRGILHTNDYGHLLKNPDDWTGLWDMPGGEDINPFRAYAKSEPQRKFAASAEHTENYLVYIPYPPQFNDITFAVDASWPGNCREPYEITGFTQLEPISPDTGSSGKVRVAVNDWQDDASYVRLSIPELTGQSETDFSHIQTSIWELDLVNAMSVPLGTYEGLVIAGSADAGGIELYDFVKVNITIPSSCGWGYDMSDGSQIWESRITTTDDGYIYIFAQFSKTMDFDPTDGVDEHSPPESCLGCGYLTKLTLVGEYVWTVTFGGYGSNIYPRGITVDDAGYIYLGGEFNNTVDFDPSDGVTEYATTFHENPFLSKFDSDGNFEWAVAWGDEYRDTSAGIAIDENGGVYTAGGFSGEADFDPGPGEDIQTSPGPNSMYAFFTKYNSNGEYQWTKTWGELSGVLCADIATDDNGNPYVLGVWGSSTLDFDPGPGEEIREPVGSISLFLSKFNPSGEFQWVSPLSYHGLIQPEAVDVTGAGECVVTGSFNTVMDFDPGPGLDVRCGNGGSDIFVYKCDTSGDVTWVRTFGGVSNDAGIGIDISSSGCILVAGKFYEEVSFGPFGQYDAGWEPDAILMSFDSSGISNWIRVWGGEDWDAQGHAVAVAPTQSVIMSGSFGDQIDIDPGPGEVMKYSSGSQDLFLVKVGPDGYW